jgi:hypothetical protein
MNTVSVYEKMTRGERLTAEFLTSLGIFWKFHHPVTIYDEEDLPRRSSILISSESKEQKSVLKM